MADLEAIHTFEGTETMKTLIVGGITGAACPSITDRRTSIASRGVRTALTALSSCRRASSAGS
jgi:hypothetical protein